MRVARIEKRCSRPTKAGAHRISGKPHVPLQVGNQQVELYTGIVNFIDVACLRRLYSVHGEKVSAQFVILAYNFARADALARKRYRDDVPFRKLPSIHKAAMVAKPDMAGLVKQRKS